jgi:hypothetical protein
MNPITIFQFTTSWQVRQRIVEIENQPDHSGGFQRGFPWLNPAALGI